MRKYKAVLFDLDGVIVSTDSYHYLAWLNLAEREGLSFNREINERLRGISRMASLDIVLENAEKNYSLEQKQELARVKNEYYKELLAELTSSDILCGVNEFLQFLKENNIKTAIASSSKNARYILKKIGLYDFFDAIIDGEQIVNSKPDPEIFIKASKAVNVDCCDCIVFEDAYAGVDGAISAGIDVVGLGYASKYEKATYQAEDMTSTKLKLLF